jgi:hypothetical protein
MSRAFVREDAGDDEPEPRLSLPPPGPPVVSGRGGAGAPGRRVRREDVRGRSGHGPGGPRPLQRPLGSAAHGCAGRRRLSGGGAAPRAPVRGAAPCGAGRGAGGGGGGVQRAASPRRRREATGYGRVEGEGEAPPPTRSASGESETPGERPGVAAALPSSPHLHRRAAGLVLAGLVLAGALVAAGQARSSREPGILTVRSSRSPTLAPIRPMRTSLTGSTRIS